MGGTTILNDTKQKMKIKVDSRSPTVAASFWGILRSGISTPKAASCLDQCSTSLTDFLTRSLCGLFLTLFPLPSGFIWSLFGSHLFFIIFTPELQSRNLSYASQAKQCEVQC